jgi:hypothetical protein
MIVAIKTVHWANGFDAGNNGFEIPLYYLIMLLTLMVFGSGKISLDNFINNRHSALSNKKIRIFFGRLKKVFKFKNKVFVRKLNIILFLNKTNTYLCLRKQIINLQRNEAKTISKADWSANYGTTQNQRIVAGRFGKEHRNFQTIVGAD